MKTIRKHGIKYHLSSPRRPNENPAESSIREIKRRWYRIMVKKSVPKRFWDFGLVWICETNNISVSSSKYANGHTPAELVTGETPDISEYTDFLFYDWVTFRTNAGLGEITHGRWIGISHKVGQLMSFWILTTGCKIISCTTVQRMTLEECQSETWKDKLQQYDVFISEKLATNNCDISASTNQQPEWNRLTLDPSHYDKDFINEFNKVIDNDNIPHAQDDIIHSKPDNYLSMEVGLPRGPDDCIETAIVKKRAVDVEGMPIGVPNDNPMLDTQQYEVQFSDGTMETLTTNVIAENILSQVDNEGHRQRLLEEIIDHRSNHNAVQEHDSFITTSSGGKRRRETTKGWEICVSWKGVDSSWVAMKDLKQSYPIELALYAKNNKIDHLPAFAWWVLFVLKKQKQILGKLKSKYWERTHKFGICIPKSIKEAIEIDKQNGNTLWQDAIAEEMAKVRVAFELYEVYSPQSSSRDVRSFLSPNGSNDRQVEEYIKKTTHLGELVRMGHLDSKDSWTALTSVALKSIEYGLPALTMTEGQCTKIMWPLLKGYLPKSGINHHFPRDVLYGQVDQFRVGLKNIYLTQCISHVVNIVHHCWHQSITGHLIQQSLELLRLELGITGNFLNFNYDVYKPVILMESWVQFVWKFMSEYDIKLEFDIPTPELCRTNDQVIMESVINLNVATPSELNQVNQCRLYLRAWSLADICTADGAFLRKDLMNGHQDKSTSQPLLWPEWGKPKRAAWTTWRQIISLVFTNGNSLRLKQPLQAWINFNFETWKWFLSEDQKKLYHHNDGQWQMHCRFYSST